MTNLELYEMSNEIQKLCINTKLDNGRIRHTLPLKDWVNSRAMNIDNWDLDKEVIERVQNNRVCLEKYASKTIKKHRSLISKIRKPKECLLPPWVVFPLFDAYTIGWRMGLGEEYEYLFQNFYTGLSPEEKEEYKKNYPIPEYMQVRYGSLYELANNE